jgi:hypothetical protein
LQESKLSSQVYTRRHISHTRVQTGLGPTDSDTN